MALDKRRKYPVKKITNIGKYKEDIWYEVEWEGYKDKDWVYDADCAGCPEKIKEFLEKFKGKPVDLKKTKPFSVEQKERVIRRRLELGLGGPGLEEALEALEVVPVPPPEVEPSQDTTGRGRKRRRIRSPKPVIENEEDEPEIEECLVLLDTYNSDLNLTIDAKDFVSGAPLTEAGFAYMFAGARATYGFINGKVYYEVKITDNLAVSHIEESEPNLHVVRVGWSVDSTTYQLGEDPFSYGYECTSKICEFGEFRDYGVPFKLNDVVGVYLDASEEKESIEISFSVNGETQGVAFTLPREELNGRALFPHILSKNCRFEVNFGQKEEPWFPPTEGYKWANEIPLGNRLRGALAPATMGDCQMIMMCGLPGAGKTTWANQFSAKNPHLKINILGTSAILSKMTVNGLPRRNYYTRRLEILHKRCLTCVNSLLTIAGKRQRNYILDLTNVYTSTQQRNMSYFSGFIRKAVVIVPTEEDAKVREDEKNQEEGQEVADYTVKLMKSNFKIPSVDDTFSEVEFPELALEEATKVIKKYNTEAINDEYGQLERQCQTQRNGHENDLNDWHSSHSGRVSNRGPPSPTSHSYLPRQEHHIPISPSLNSEEKVIEEEILPDSGEPIDPLAEESVEHIRALKDGHQVEAVEDEIEFLEVFMDTEELEERSEEERQRNRSPKPVIENEEDEPEYDGSLVLLDCFNSDLNLTINKTDFVSGAPLTEAGFAYMWAGVRATYGFANGKVCYEVKITENLAVSHIKESEPNRHVVRVGWSVDSTTYQLGEDPFSYGYEGTAKISQNCEFRDYGVPFKLNDVVGVYLDASEEKESIEISFSVNGETQGVAFTLPREELNGRALFPHILTKNCGFEVNFGQKEEPWFPQTVGYEWASKIPLGNRLRGALAPATMGDCQFIAMCGLPGVGKTTWANQFSAENPHLKINILGTSAFLDKMKVNGLPRRNYLLDYYTGRPQDVIQKKWFKFIDNCLEVVNIVIKIAAKRRRNYILDQTNIYLAALRKKMKLFSGFKRKVVVIVPTEEDAMVRAEKKRQEKGQDVHDSIALDMIANFKIPSVNMTFSKVEFPELALEEATKVIEKCKTNAKAVKVGLLKLKIEPENQENGQNNDRNNKENTVPGQSNHNERDSNRGQTPPLPLNDLDPPRPESSLLEKGKKRKKRSGMKKPETCHRCNSEEHQIKDCPVPKKKKKKKKNKK